jgi:hypothetical protein
MNYDLNNFDDREFKNVEFSMVQIGQEFYARRPRLTSYGEDDVLPLKKISSAKSDKGVWTNARSKLGQDSFIPYDRKVLILTNK